MSETGAEPPVEATASSTAAPSVSAMLVPVSPSAPETH
jgi:hypothetical protein